MLNCNKLLKWKNIVWLKLLGIFLKISLEISGWWMDIQPICELLASIKNLGKEDLIFLEPIERLHHLIRRKIFF
jgi:hypothetical protein